MLLLLPPSEGKTLPDETTDFDLENIEPFRQELREARLAVLDELIRTSERPDALSILKVGKSIADEVDANRALLSSQAAAAWQVYSGVLFEAGGFAKVGASYSPSPRFEVLVQSALFGAVDLASSIPAYRLSMDTKLPQLGSLASWWKSHLGELMDSKAKHRMVVDARSGAYQKAWPGLRGDFDLIRINALRERNGKRTVVSHNAKKYRGILAGALLQRSTEATDSLDFVLDTAHSITSEDFSNVEVREQKGYLELVIVTH